MKVVVVWCVLWCSQSIFGDNITFIIDEHISQGVCRAECNLKNKNDVTVEEGDDIWLLMESRHHIQKSSCHVIQKGGVNTTLQTPSDNDNSHDGWYLKKKAAKHLTGNWSCKLGFGSPHTSMEPNVDGYTQVICQVNIVVKALGFTRIPFNVAIENGQLKCKQGKIIGPMLDKQKFEIMATSPDSTFAIGKCFLNDVVEPFLTFENSSDPKTMHSRYEYFNTTMNGKSLMCKFGIKNNKKIAYDSKEYDEVVCETQELVIQEVSDIRQETDETKNTTMWIIIASVGILGALIICGQTVALFYFKTRAQRRNGLDNLITRNRPFDRSDQARYSAPPSRRNTIKTNRANADTDSHIYEMVGVNALYKDSGNMEIKNRPPLPLPVELPVDQPVVPPPIETLPRPAKLQHMQSTRSLNNVGSSSTVPRRPVKNEPMPPPQLTVFNKAIIAPGRLPNQYDEESLPGSLRRPPKPTGLASKTGSMPKMPANDPAFAELKNALRKRQEGNASPLASPMATLERKQPPKMPIKPRKNPLPTPDADASPLNPLAPPTSRSLPHRSVNPFSNQLKLPTCDVNSLTSPRHLKSRPFGGVNPLSPPIGVINPFSPNHIPKVDATTKPVPPKRPLKPNVAGTTAHPSRGFQSTELEPVQSTVPVPSKPQNMSHGKPARPLAPIPQSEEDLRQMDSDEEEWSYEALDDYHIYNL